MSFGDLAQHLIDADDWPAKKLDDPLLEPMVGRSQSAVVSSYRQYLDLVADLEMRGRRRTELLARLEPERLSELMPDASFGGEVSVWWVIVRGNLDHEIHHRDQVAADLRSLGVTV